MSATSIISLMDFVLARIIGDVELNSMEKAFTTFVSSAFFARRWALVSGNTGVVYLLL